MITGVHAIVFTPQAEGLRAFFADVLRFPSIDAGNGWLIFSLPPAELAAHPAESGGEHRLYLMCDDIESTMTELAARGAEFTGPVSDAGFGLETALRLPDGSELGLYEPRHTSSLRGTSTGGRS